MKTFGAALSLSWVALAVAIACAASVTDPDSETHWLRACAMDADCSSGLSCLCNTCTRPCGSDDCKSLGSGAKCVTPESAAVSAACAAPTSGAICTTPCSADRDCAGSGSALRCIGGACLAGSAGKHADSGPPVSAGERCGATPKTLVAPADLFAADSGLPDVSAGMDVTVNGTDLYYTYDDGGDITNGKSYAGSVMRVPLTGGRPTPVAPIDGGEEALLLTSTSLVFAESGVAGDGSVTGQIVRVPFDGGPPVALARTTGGTTGTLATDGRNVYFADDDGTKSVPLSGGTVRLITPQSGSIALVGTDLILVSSAYAEPTGTVFSIPAAGGTLRTLATNQPGANLPIQCGVDICWTTGVPGETAGSGTGAIIRLNPAGTPQTVAQGSLYLARRFLFDGTNFFIAVYGDADLEGEVLRIPASGGTPVYVEGGYGIAVDDQCLYTASIGTGIVSVVKTYTPPSN